MSRSKSKRERRPQLPPVSELIPELKDERAKAMSRFPGFRIRKEWDADVEAAAKTFEESGNEGQLQKSLFDLLRGLRNLQRAFFRNSTQYFQDRFGALCDKFGSDVDQDLQSRYAKASGEIRLHANSQTEFNLDTAGEIYRSIQSVLVEICAEQTSRNKKRDQRDREEADRQRLADEANRQRLIDEEAACQRELALQRRANTAASVRSILTSCRITESPIDIVH